MAIRLQSEFRTLNDDQYRIKILDSAYLGNPFDVNIGGDGFTLTHDGEVDTLFSPIVGSSVTLTIYNNDSAIDAFRTALLNSQDKQISIRIEKWNKPRSRNVADDYRNRVVSDGGTYEAGECVNDALFALGVGTESRSYIWQQSNQSRVLADGGTYEGGLCVIDAIDALGGSKTIPDEEFDLYWTGYIVQDLIEEADESKPRAISLRAADGISILSTIDYEFNVSQSFQKTFKDIVTEILTDGGMNSLFESDETMLTSVVNWYAEQHTYSSTSDPMDLTKFDLKAFSEYQSDGTRSFTNALQVIREMCIIMGARFYFDDGSFRFEQISERDNIDVREFYYLNDGTSNGNAVIQLDTLVDQDTAHRSGGTFRYLPAVKKVSLIQQKTSSANIIGRSVDFPTDEIDVGVIPSADNGRVILTMRSELQTFISNPLQGTATPVFDVTIRLEPSDGSADQYWKNSFIVNSLVFGTGSWSTTPNTFKWAGNTISRSSSLKTISNHSMSTGPLPKDGEIFIDIAINGFYDFGLDPTFISSPNSYAYKVTLETARFENDNNPSSVVSSTFEANNTSTGLGSNININLGPTRLGDGAGAVGSLYAYTGSSWQPSTGWRVGNSGTYIDVAKLMTRETLGLQSKVVNRFEGTIINGGGGFKNRLRFDSAYWLPLRSTLTANNDQFEIEAFKIARVIETVDVSNEPIDVNDDSMVVGVADFNGQYANFGSGAVGGMLVDVDNNAVGPFSETASGGKITGSALVTGDTTMEGGLDHQGFLIEEITDVTHSSGSTYDVQDTEYMIFNTWSGGTGTATVNLPSAADNEGRLLRFKSDGTIAANKIVNLRPADGETIDGNGEFAFDRDYDGVMLLAHNDEWFIIQRKAK